MLSYNILLSYRMLSEHSRLEQEQQADEKALDPTGAAQEVADNTRRIAHLKVLFIAVKIANQSNTHVAKYPQHDLRASRHFRFMVTGHP